MFNSGLLMVVLIRFCSSLSPLESTVVLVQKRPPKSICMGGIMSPHLVLTSCGCLGKFELKGPHDFEFNQIEINEHYVATSDHQKYDIEKLILHLHCRPSQFETNKTNVYDIGIIKVTNEFHFKWFKVIKTDGRSRVPYLQMVDRGDLCTVVYNGLSEEINFKENFLQLVETVSCLRLSCNQFFQAGKIEEKCSLLITSSIRDTIECSFALGLDSKKKTYAGAPIFCENVVWGVLSSLAEDFTHCILWTRMDLEPNSDFFSRNYRYDSAIKNRINFFLLIAFLNLNKNIW